jgi:hypothetical protein
VSRIYGASGPVILIDLKLKRTKKKLFTTVVVVVGFFLNQGASLETADK